ncbi:hypothetical protein evm_011969 [Chilo suppressalis]|nr:hypothetical protein evm_011969 [Chilo suppressalis]
MRHGDSELGDAYDLDEALELTGHGHYNYQLLTACSILSHGVALDMFGFNVVLAAASCDLELGIVESGALASAPFAGVIFAFLWGYYADTRGRRRAILLSSSVGFIMAALSSLAPCWQAMLALKLIGCSFSTASFSLTMTYLGECTGPKLRDRYIFIMTSANLASEIVAFAYFLLQLNFIVPITWLAITYRPWRLFTFIMASPLGMGAVMIYFLQESPKFLAERSSSKETVKVLKVIYEMNGGKKDDYPVKDIKMDHSERRNERFWSSLMKQTTPLFKPPLFWITLQLFYLMTIAISTNNVFIMWFSIFVNLFFNSLTVDNDNGSFCERIVSNLTVPQSDSITCSDTISSNTLYSGMLLGLFYTFVTLLVSRIASWRRLVLITSFTIAAISGILVDLLKEPWANLIVFVLLQGTLLGIGSVASYFVDLYPTACRGLAMSLAMMTARLVALAGVNAVGAVIVNHCSLTFYAWTVLIAGGVIVVFFLPAHKVTKK